MVSFIGNGLPTLVRRVMEARGIPATEFDRLHARVLDAYTASNSAHTRVFDGVYDVLVALRAQGSRLAVCTNKPLEPAQHVLRDMGLDGFFDSVVGGDSLAVRKPDPEPLFLAMEDTDVEDVLYVGDSEVDAETAARAGVRFALFTEGYRKSPVGEIAHDHSFSHWRDFLKATTAKM